MSKEGAPVSKRYRKSLQKVTMSPGSTPAEVEGSHIMDTLEKMARADGKEECESTHCFFQNETQIVIFKMLEKNLRKNILGFVFSFLSGPVHKF